MIVSTVGSTSLTLGGNEQIRWRSLARRGMLHSECESFEYVQLAPRTEFALRGREGTESAWFTVSGSGSARESGAAATEHALSGGELILVPAGCDITIAAGGGGLDLLWIEVMPGGVVQALPPRRPVV